jgi:hypothetical protein
VHFVEAKRDINGRDARFLVLSRQVLKQLITGDGQIAHASLEEVSGKGGLRCHHELGRLGPAPDLTEQRAESAEILLVRTLLGPYLGYGEAEHGLKVRGER